MRTTETVEETVTKNITTTTCDFCQVPVPPYLGGFPQCKFCKRDMCQTHEGYLYRDPIYGGDYGDCPPRICKECAVASESFADQASAIRERHNVELEAIEQAWKDACKIVV